MRDLHRNMTDIDAERCRRPPEEDADGSCATSSLAVSMRHRRSRSLHPRKPKCPQEAFLGEHSLYERVIVR